MADKKSLIDHWMDMEEDQPVGTAGMFNTAPDPKEVDQVSQAASDWWEWRNAKGWNLNPRDVAEGLAGQPLGAIAGTISKASKLEKALGDASREQYIAARTPNFKQALQQLGEAFNLNKLDPETLAKMYDAQPPKVRGDDLHPDEVEAIRNWIESDPDLMDYMDASMRLRQGKEQHFAEGGTVMDTMKQGFMQPPGEAGALPIEKADTVPAKLSEGEFVIPAEEVRWHGLKTFMQMKLEAEEGLRTMESIGQIREPGQPEAVQTEIAPPDQYATGGLINKRMGLNPDYNLLNPDTKVLQDQEKNSFFIPPPWAGGAGDPADGSVGGVNDNMTLMDAVANIGMFATNPVGFAVSAMLAQRDNPNMTTVPSITTTIGKALGLIDKDPTDYGFMPAFDREKDNVTLDTDPAFSQPPEKSISDTFKDETDNAVKDAAANFGGIKGDPTANVSNDPVNGMIEGSLSNPTSPAIDANATIDGPSSPSSPADPTGPTGPSSPSDPTGPSDPSSDPSSDSDGGSDGDGYAKGGLIKRPKRDTKKK